MSYNYNSYSQGAQGAQGGGYQQQHQQQQQQGYGGSYGGGGGGYGGGYGQQQQQGRYPPQNSYSQQQQGPPPPQGGNSRDQLWQWFAAVDIDRSGEITAEELKQALVNGDWSPFDIDTVKLLMNIFDTDRTGTIAFEEFQGLWQYIKDWQRVFRHFDADSSGTIEANELSRALNQFGYNLSPKLLTILERKYDIHGKNKTEAGSLPTKGNQINGITFDRFVRCCVVVKSLTESFQRLDGDRDGWVNMSYEQFMDIVLASP